MKREDKLLLGMWGPEVSLGSLAGVGPATLQRAEQAGYVTSVHATDRYFSGMDYRVTITEAGSSRLRILREEERRKHDVELASKVEHLGPCIACGATVEPHQLKWRCSDAVCPLHMDVPEAYWLALRATVVELDREHEEALEYAEQHGNRCTCRECYHWP